MRALVLEEPGDNPRLVIEERELPPLGPEDVLVKVHACGVCYHDVLVMQGVLRRGVKERPVLGHEISGTVAQVGESVEGFHIDDPVASIFTEPCGHCGQCLRGREQRCVRGRGIGHRIDGGFAEYVKLHLNALVPLPAGADLDTACIYGCPIGVAYNAIKDVAQLQAGERALVTGAGGGLGVHSIQIARALGARVFAVTSSAEKMDRITELGADEVLLMDGLDFSELVMALTEDAGIDVVVENVMSATFESSFRSLAQFGRLVIVGAIGASQMELNPAELIFRDAHIIGTGGATRQQLREVADLVEQGRIRPIVSQSFPLEEAVEAYRAMLEKQTFGRVTLRP
jgi:D-arabinose 1-dehydrogenase-like Zn-dependent alcohol dehydrogenase